MIRHTVAFTLKHAPGSDDEHDFLRAARELAHIESVRNFEALKQMSAKCAYRFGLSIEFDSPEDYDFYNRHPTHVRFVQSRWVAEVAAFQEMDYEPLEV